MELFASAVGFKEYQDRTNALFDRVFTPCSGESVIVGRKPEEYATLREYTRLHGGMRFDHTIVFQVDEYWQAAEPITRSSKLLPKAAGDSLDVGYLSELTCDRHGNPHRVHDPYFVYQANERAEHREPKYHRFQLRGYGDDKEWSRRLSQSHLVPYFWDFGFLLLKRSAW